MKCNYLIFIYKYFNSVIIFFLNLQFICRCLRKIQWPRLFRAFSSGWCVKRTVHVSSWYQVFYSLTFLKKSFIWLGFGFIQINVLLGKRGGSVNYLNIICGPRGRVNELVFLARLRTHAQAVKGKQNEGKNGKWDGHVRFMRFVRKYHVGVSNSRLAKPILREKNPTVLHQSRKVVRNTET